MVSRRERRDAQLAKRIARHEKALLMVPEELWLTLLAADGTRPALAHQRRYVQAKVFFETGRRRKLKHLTIGQAVAILQAFELDVAAFWLESSATIAQNRIYIRSSLGPLGLIALGAYEPLGWVFTVTSVAILVAVWGILEWHQARLHHALAYMQLSLHPAIASFLSDQ